MALSKSARRRRAGMANVPYARMRPNVTNWVIGGSATDNTGGVIGGGAPTGPATWLPATGVGPASYGLVSGAPVSFQAVAIVAAPNTSTPTIGRMKIDEVRGTLELTNFQLVADPFTAAAAAHRVNVAVCIYVSEFNSNTGKWDVRDPLSTADAARDDYFFLEGRSVYFPASAVTAAPTSVCFDLKLANPLIIGGGQALHVTISMVSTLGATYQGALSSYFRTRVGPVA